MTLTLKLPDLDFKPLLLAGGLCAAALFLASPSWGQENRNDFRRQVTVSGLGEVHAVPDKANVSAGVISLGDTAAQALQKNTTNMRAVFDALIQLGIAEKDIQTSNFSVSPRYGRYEKSDVPPKIVGYQVSNSVSIVIRDLEKLGEALDSFVTAGANNLGGVQFTFSDPSALQVKARIAAIEDAKARAKLYAETAGASLGEVLIIQESSVPRPMPVMARMASFAEDSSVPIAAGEGTVSSSVTVTFALK